MLIEERRTLKIPGQTSLFINFENNFDKNFNNLIKQLPIKYYHKNLNEWEIPIDKLSFVLNNMDLDKVALMRVLEENKTPSFSIPSNTYFKTKPYKYQLEGITYGLNHENWLLLDEMGLGKTLQMIYLAEVLQQTENLKHCCIVCGVNTLKWNWLEEIKKHSKLDAYLLGQRFKKDGSIYVGTVQERAEDLLKEIKEFFIITNIETIRDNNVVKAFEKNKNNIDLMIFDECHKAKGYNTQQGKNFLKLTFPKRKIAMTGTLLLNKPLDAYTPLKWIGVEKSSNYQFKQNYCNFGGYGNYQIVGYKNLNQLNDQIKSCSLRRLKKDVLDLPEKTYQLEYVEMDKVQKDFYNNIIEGIIDEIDLVEINQAYELSIKQRLRQATAWTGILSSEVQVSAKLDRLEELVEEITENNNKVLVFSTYKKTLEECERRFSKYNYVRCDGDCKDSEIQERIQKFKTDPSCNVIFATHQKLGTGITLTEANYVIFIDVPWNSGLYEQAVDRIYRIGQKNKITAINLITKGTYDERVQNILNQKKELADFILDDKVSAKMLLKSMLL